MMRNCSSTTSPVSKLIIPLPLSYLFTVAFMINHICSQETWKDIISLHSGIACGLIIITVLFSSIEII